MTVSTPTSSPKTISLIGMPGAGKSTVGVILAKRTGLRFVDTDLEIQCREGATLQQILEAQDYLYLRRVEEEVLLGLELAEAIISTGGSVVYSDEVMQRLGSAGPVVYLDTDFDTLSQRVAMAPDRGIASSSGESFKDIYAERTPLYARYASQRIDTAGGNADEVCARIIAELAIG